MGYKINIPNTLTKDTDKLNWLLNLKEKLRVEHNKNGQQMNNSDFKSWVKTYYEPVIQELFIERDNLKLKLELDNNYTIDLNTAITQV